MAEWIVKEDHDIDLGMHGRAEIGVLGGAIMGELIRCKECEHYNAGFECLIDGYGIERNPNWFCADGERRTDDCI